MSCIKLVFLFFLFPQTSFADMGKELYEEDCAFSCHQPDPKLGHVALVITDRFDLRSQIKTCSKNFAPFWSGEDRSAVIDCLYRAYYEPTMDEPFG